MSLPFNNNLRVSVKLAFPPASGQTQKSSAAKFHGVPSQEDKGRALDFKLGMLARRWH